MCVAGTLAIVLARAHAHSGARIRNNIVPPAAGRAGIWKTFDAQYSAEYRELMRKKLGLSEWVGGADYPGCRDPAEVPDAAGAAPRDDEELLEGFFRLLAAHSVDFTNAFRALSAVASSPRDGEAAVDEPLLRLLPAGASEGARGDVAAWLARYRARLAASALSEEERVSLQVCVCVCMCVCVCV